MSKALLAAAATPAAAVARAGTQANIDRTESGCYAATYAENAVGARVINYSYPEGHVYRYGCNRSPGSTPMTTAIQTALDVAGLSRAGRIAYLPADTCLITATVHARSCTQLVGSFGETKLGGGAVSECGSRLVWGGGVNSSMLSVSNTRLFQLDGIALDANGVPGTTCILLDSDNHPSGSQNEFHRFSLRNFAIGVQWGTSGIAGGSYANDGTRFSTFTMWSQVSGSKGIVVDSGNAGQMSVIESGGIQVDDTGIDIRVANLLQIRRVFGGWALKTAFIRSSVGVDILIEGCSSEGWGAKGSWRASDSKFLWIVAPVEKYPMLETTINLICNQINNPIQVDYPVRINSYGDAWGYCLNAADHRTSIPAIGTFTSGKSRVLALINGINPGSINLSTNEPVHGWVDSEFVNLTRLDPGLDWISPTFSAGNFAADGAMTWTVGAADVETYAYTLCNRTMTLTFKINSSSVGGIPNSLLKIRIPGEKVSSRGVLSMCRIANPSASVGICYVEEGATHLYIRRNDLSDFVAGQKDVAVQGQLTFEIW
jgi:hypothetical protein